MSANQILNFPASPRAAKPEAPEPPRAGAMHVRSLIADDLEPVADLFMQRFRPGAASPRARAEIAACLKSLYLENAEGACAADSLVAFDPSGAVAAFSAAARTRFLFDGRPASVLTSGTLMASSAPGHALAAVQLLRESRKLDCDLIVTDSANRASLGVCQAIGYQVVSPDSLEWACVFDPASLALHKIRQKLGQRWLGALTPLARAVDFAAAAALSAVAGAPKPSDWRDEEVDDETFVDIAPRFHAPFRLTPDFSRTEFLRLVGLARQRQSAGPLHLQVVRDGAGAPAAAYACYGGKGEVARVFHLAAAPHAWGRMFDRIRETARARGCIGAHGPLKRPMMASAYAVRGVFFYYANGMLAYSNRPEIRRVLETGEALLGGFAGDRWTRLASDRFG